MLLFVIHLCKNAVCGSWTFASGLWDADKTLWQRQVVLAPSPIPEFKTLVPRRTKEMPTLAGHLPTTAHCLYWIIIMCIYIYIWYMHVFVHVYAMIITIEICFYIFIHNQDCPHMSCFLVECKCQCVFFWCLDPIYVASVFLHMDISSMRSPPVDCVAHHRGSLLFCRGAVGAAMGGLLPASFAIVGDMYPPEERPHAIAMMAAAWLIFLFHLKT